MQRSQLGATIDVYIAKPVRCPYLADREERKLLVPLGDGTQSDAIALYDSLIAVGFRRSGRWAFRPRCVGCIACVPVRIRLDAFAPTRSQRRVARRTRALSMSAAPPTVNFQDYSLFSSYLRARHGDGDMMAMGERDFIAMVKGDVVRTELLRWRDETGALVASMLVDVVADGLSLVYSYFDPARARDSLGVAMVLAAIDEARRRDLAYVYLGYWVEGCRKMEYKAAFAGLEAFGARGWQRLETPPG